MINKKNDIVPSEIESLDKIKGFIYDNKTFFCEPLTHFRNIHFSALSINFTFVLLETNECQSFICSLFIECDNPLFTISIYNDYNILFTFTSNLNNLDNIYIPPNCKLSINATNIIDNLLINAVSYWSEKNIEIASDKIPEITEILIDDKISTAIIPINSEIQSILNIQQTYKQKIEQNDLLTLQINNITGNDSTADGTINKPFNTCAAAIKYIKDRYELLYQETNPGSAKVIIQLADSPTPYSGLFFSDLHIGLEIDGNISNPSAVQWNGLLEFYASELVVRGINFITTSTLINSIKIGRARVSLFNCIFSGVHTGRFVIFLNRYSIIQFTQVSISNNCAKFINVNQSHCVIEFNSGNSANGTYTTSFIDIQKPYCYVEILAKIAGISSGTGVLTDSHSRILNRTNLPDGSTTVIVSDSPIVTKISSFLNGWASFGAGVYATDEQNGFISVQGSISGSTPDTLAFSLAGYKPYGFTSTSQILIVPAFTASGSIVRIIISYTVSNSIAFIPSSFTGTQTIYFNFRLKVQQ